MSSSPDLAQSALVAANLFLRGDRYYDFCKTVMGRDLEPQPHWEMCAVVESAVKSFEKYYVDGVTPGPNDKNYYLALAPRDSFKSTVFNECLVTWLLLKFPNIRILVDSETIGKASKFVQAVQSHLEGNSILRGLYGDLTPKRRDEAVWRRDSFTISTRTKIGTREPSVSSSGIGQTQPGMHYDFIIADDLVSEKNVTTDDQIQKTVDHIKLAQSLLSPGGVLFIIGTRWHFFDPYGYIINDPNQSAVYNKYIRSAGGVHDKGAPLYFPGRLTQAFLDKKRKIQGPYIYSCQYQNNPIPEGEQQFNVEKYNVISGDTFRSDVLGVRPYNWFFLVDPALTSEASKKGDYTAISPYILTDDGNIYLYKPLAVREMADTLVDTIYNHQRVLTSELGQTTYNYIETIAFQKLLLPLLKKKEAECGHKIYWNELKPESRTSKEVRIRSALPYLESGNLYLVEEGESPNVHTLTGANRMLIDQALRFPLTKNDDLLDLQGYIIQVKVHPNPFKSSKKAVDFDHDWGDNDEDAEIPEHWPED